MCRPTIFVATILVAVLVAGCGDDDDGGGTDAGSDAAVARDAGGGGDAGMDAAIATDAGAADATTPVDARADATVADAGAAGDSGSGGDAAIATDAGARVDAAIVDGGAAARCIASGGTVDTSLCCASAGDFPNLCLVGPCGCAPASSHSVMVCRCAGAMCFNGTTCTTP